MVDEVEVSENSEALIVLAGTVAGDATTFVASLPIPLRSKFELLRFSGQWRGRFCSTED